HGRAYISLPDDAAVHSVQRINVVQFSCCYDRRPAARSIVDIQGLGINVSGDCSIEPQIPRQVTSRTLCERGINIKTVTRIVSMMLCYIYLCLCALGIAENSKAHRGKNDPGTPLVVAAWYSQGRACPLWRVSPCWREPARKAPRHSPRRVDSEAATEVGSNQQ